jgi:hypothetical protein
MDGTREGVHEIRMIPGNVAALSELAMPGIVPRHPVGSRAWRAPVLRKGGEWSRTEVPLSVVQTAEQRPLAQDQLELGGELFCTDSPQNGGHTLARTHCGAPMLLSADHAIPLGLLINELVTNAVKNTYPEGSGEIEVSAREMNGHLHVEVSDLGAGLPLGFDIDQPRATLGFSRCHSEQHCTGHNNARSRPPASGGVRYSSLLNAVLREKPEIERDDPSSKI